MLSTVSTIFPTEPILVNPFSSLEKEFTPWVDFPESLFSTTELKLQVLNFNSSSGSDEPNTTNSNSGSPELVIMDERKRRRMISNRESARRSRMRKQKHLENIRNQVTRLRVENRDLTNRLRYILLHYHGLMTENQKLRSEQAGLRQRLNDIQQLLEVWQVQQSASSWAMQ